MLRYVIIVIMIIITIKFYHAKTYRLTSELS